MDPSFYKDLTGRLHGPPIVLQDRLNFDGTSVIHQFTDARQYALALEEIARTAAHREIGSTAREHAGVLALAGLAGVPARAKQATSASELVRELAAHG